MRLGGCGASTRQDKGFWLRSFFLQRVNALLKLGNISSGQVRRHSEVGVRQFATDMEQLLLNSDEHVQFALWNTER